MLKLVSTEVPSLEEFMKKYNVSQSPLTALSSTSFTDITRKMDNPAALHRLKVGVPATVEHATEQGAETAKWVAETTQVRRSHVPSPMDDSL